MPETPSGAGDVRQFRERVITPLRSVGDPAETAQWGERGVDLYYLGSDTAVMKSGAQRFVELARGG